MVNLGKTYWTLKLCRTAKSYQEPHFNCRHNKHNLYMMYVCMYMCMYLCRYELALKNCQTNDVDGLKKPKNNARFK